MQSLQEIAKLQKLAGIQPQKLEEGWKENLLFIGAMALSNLGLKSFAQDTPQQDRVKQGIEIKKEDKKDFYASMVGAISDIQNNFVDKGMTQEQLSGFKEARKYFESLRDGKEVDLNRLSSAGKAAVNYTFSVVKKASPQQIQDYINLGANIKSI